MRNTPKFARMKNPSWSSWSIAMALWLIRILNKTKKTMKSTIIINYWGNHQPSTINNNREMIIVDNSWNLHVFEIINHSHLSCHPVSEAIESRIPHAKRIRSEAMAGHPAIPRPSAGDTFPGQIHEWYAGWGPPVLSWFTNPLGIPISFISPS